MKQLVYSIYDSKAEIFNNPMFFIGRGQAIRGFSDEANRAESEIHRHPEDYTLFQIGTFDVGTGLLEPLPTPKSEGLAIEFINQEKIK